MLHFEERKDEERRDEERRDEEDDEDDPGVTVSSPRIRTLPPAMDLELQSLHIKILPAMDLELQSLHIKILPTKDPGVTVSLLKDTHPFS